VDYPTELKVGSKSVTVEYEVVLKGTSSVRFSGGRVLMKLSRFVRVGQRDKMVEKFLKWAEKRLEKVDSSSWIAPVYEDGGRICTHNKNYFLTVVEAKGGKSGVKLLEGNQIEVSLGHVVTLEEIPFKIKELVEKRIIKDQTPYLEDVVDELNQLHFQEDYGMVRFKRMNGRFGSCSSKRNLNIAFRLLFAPRDVFRYVCVHELAHLREFNHSKRFWDLVHGAMPEYKIYEKWLKNSGFVLG